ncbi:MAG: ABC transporter permease, partial [Armatimonadetes bacterium]|nr:ABC transporter permease [Armatimonadota bacterium]
MTQFLGRALRHKPGAVVGAVLVAFFALLALFAPWIGPHDPFYLFPGAPLHPPSERFPFGTDELGRDILSRVIYGSRISMQVGLITVGIAMGGGTTLGLLAGYRGGRLDALIMGATDIMLAFPQILLALAILAMLGPNLYNAMVAVGLSAVPVYARTVRGSTLAIRGRDYIEAARALGAGDARIVTRHVLPNVLAPIIVLATVGLGTSILIAAGLSYLGLGAQPPLPEWGAMLSDARSYLRSAWW